MTTYSGRSASYIPGKEVVNKEPPVSRYVVEKLYRVHRERIMKVQPTIDSHVKIPDFLTNQSWKKNAEKQKKVVIARENQDIYGRIAKVENSEGLITKENKVHVKRVEAKLAYLKKLKEHGRLVQMVKIQKENELFLKRLEKAHPQYTIKGCKEWYRHHERFKMGRRTDPTAGHIMHNMKGLLPHTLPPLSGTLTTNLDRSETITAGSHRLKKLPGLGGPSPRVLRSSSNSMLSSIASESRMEGSESSLFQDLQSQGSARKSGLKRMPSSGSGHRKTITAEEGSRSGPGTARRGQGDSAKDSVQLSEQADEPDDYAEDTFSDAGSHYSHESASDDLMLLASRPFAIPFDSKNCLVQIYAPRQYDENLRLRIISSGINPQRLAERLLPIDRAYEIVNAGGQSSQIVHSTDNEDLQSLSTMLINMFKEADDDGSGSLTFDEFQKLMEQVELGISAQELRFVISEADENENGVVDYEEFVPLAVDLIQSFRARNRAKTMNSQEDVLVDDQILSTISSTELKRAAEKCLEKIYTFDSKRYGLIRVPDLKKCLNQVAPVVGIADNEISMLCQLLPRDQFGRLKYNATPTTFYDCLSKVRFMTMKNAIIESQGSGLQKYLLDLCKEEEKKLLISNYHSHSPVISKDKFVPTGIIPCRSLINILSNSPRLSLSRLQVLVIMSEASVLDGMINYFQFVPVVAKAIEIMFEPKALRQRAELIEKTDLSPEALLQGMSSEMFEQRLLTLFKSYDIDHNGTLDQNEFIACLESLDLQLTYGEMVALMAAADVAQHGFLKFEDFVGFFTHNLLNLEREKHIRLLQNSLHNSNKKKSGKGLGSMSTASASQDTYDSLSNRQKVAEAAGDTSAEQDLTSRLLALFRLHDPTDTGYIPFEDFETILQNLSINVSKFLIDVLVSELNVNDDGLVEYQKSLSTCTELFRIYKAKESVEEENKVREKSAEDKAVKITEACSDEIHQIVRYLMKKFKQVNENQLLSPIAKYLEIQEVIRSPNSGLSRNESNMILTKLFMGINDQRIHHSMKSASEDELHAGASFSLPTGSPTSTTAAATAGAGAGAGGGAAGGIAIPPPLNLAMEYTPMRNAAKTPKFRNSIKSLRFQFSSQELYQAIFEAKKITIMRSLLQEIDLDSTQQMILTALQEELLQRQKANEISPDSTFLPVSICYQVLENLLELRLNRAQIMFLISLADCYDREGKLLEIYRFAEHASAIISQIHDSDVLETRAEVMNITVIDDRKTFQGLREKEFLDELSQHIEQFIEQRKHHIKELSLNHQAYLLGHATSSASPSVKEKASRKEEDDEASVEDYLAENEGKVDEEFEAHRVKASQPQRQKKHFQEDEDATRSEEHLMEANEAKLQFLLQLDEETIGKEELYDILKTLPRNKLQDHEITTILAGLRIHKAKVKTPKAVARSSSSAATNSAKEEEDDEFLSIRASISTVDVSSLEILPWRELLPHLVEAIRSYQREHIIHRRVSLIATSMALQPTTPTAEGQSIAGSSSRDKGDSENTSIVRQKLQEDSLKTLKQLAEKLLNYVKIVTQGDGGINLQLPLDANHPGGLRRTSSQILSKEDLSLNDLNNTDITSLYRSAAFVSFFTTRTIVLPPVAEKGRKFTGNTREASSANLSTGGGPLNAAASSANLLLSGNASASASTQNLGTVARSSSTMFSPTAGGGGGRGQNSPNRSSVQYPGSSQSLLDLVGGSAPSGPNTVTEIVQERKEPLFIQILSIEDTRYYSASTLVANFVSVDSSFSACESLPVKLPTIGSVDQEAAREFAANLIERMYFEMDEREKVPVLKIKEI